jgi:hypothetical protein
MNKQTKKRLYSYLIHQKLMLTLAALFKSNYEKF